MNLSNQALADRFGQRIARRLSDGTDALPHNVSERLRAAREQALSRRKVVRHQTATAVLSGGGAALVLGGDERPGWWGRMASVLPLLALVVGFLVIEAVQNDIRANEVAEVDAALLTDDLPPAAYTDPGFMQFLKAARDPGPAVPLSAAQ